MTSTTHQVLPAEPIGSGKLMSIGIASYMLIKQYNFPNIYEEKEEMHSVDSDRLESFNSAEYKANIEKHYKDSYPNAMHYGIKSSSDEVNLKAIIEISDADVNEKWTGYRVMGTVDASGWNIYTLQLFAKSPDTKTEVFSNNDAPNVLEGKRYQY